MGSGGAGVVGAEVIQALRCILRRVCLLCALPGCVPGVPVSPETCSIRTTHNGTARLQVKQLLKGNKPLLAKYEETLLGERVGSGL